MRVLVACDWFLKYAVSQASALHRAGIDVSLLCRAHALEFGGRYDEREEVLGRLNGIAVQVLRGRVSSPAAALDVVALRREVRRMSPDLVHAHDNADPRLLSIVAGFPRVTTIHDPVPHPGHPQISRIEQAVRDCWIAGSASVVVHGDALVGELPAWVSRDKVAIVPHGAAVRERPLPRPAEPCVLLFGRLEAYKGIDVLLRGMEHVWSMRPEVRLVIAGAGPEASIVPSDPRIWLRDEYIQEGDLDTLFSAASVAVLPYVQASQSGAGAYALARGVPTIVSDAGALAEIALDPSFVVTAGDDHGLAMSILRHLDHDDELRRAVLAFARERLSWDACARRSLELYSDVLAVDRP